MNVEYSRVIFTHLTPVAPLGEGSVSPPIFLFIKSIPKEEKEEIIIIITVFLMTKFQKCTKIMFFKVKIKNTCFTAKIMKLS